jgi:bifunctional non-homologous end joining protein LigD
LYYDLVPVEVPLTHVERVVFPDVGITKGEIIAYYREVADVMLPELRGRPLTIERFTKTIEQGGFYQKHAQKHYPAWIERVSLGSKTIVAYPLCDTRDALVYFANQGGFVLHVWTSRRAAPQFPDLLVFDLDPPEGGFQLVSTAARHVRELLDELDLPAFVKTTGSKGLHVVAPLDPHASFDSVGALGHAIAAVLCQRHPDTLTTEFYKKDRRGRLFLDTMRNAPGATVVAPYSLRGRPGAPVSAPIEWAEVDDPALAADGIRLRDVRARLDSRGDPWRDLRAAPGSADEAARRLAALVSSPP